METAPKVSGPAEGKVNPESGSPQEEVFVFPTTPAQQRFWLLDQIQPGNPALNFPLAARLTGRLDATLMERAANEIIRRHEILRTSFQTMEKDVVQVIHPERILRLEWHDLTTLPEAERETRASQLLLAESKIPFSLTDGLFLRGGLIKLRPEEHILMLTLHHIVCDGWSNGIMMRELAETYTALLEGREGPAELPIQYADYAQWQHDWLASPAAEEQRQFWKTQLQGTLPFLSLPTDRPRKAGRSSNSSIHTLLLPKSLTEGLKTLCVRENVTPFMLFFATYATLLFRYTGQRDLVVGSPAANRSQADLEGLIGLFSNPLMLRLKLDGDLTIRSLFSQVKERSLAAFDHQMFPFERLLEELQINPHRSGLSWPQAYFIYQKAFMVPQQMPELTLTPLRSVSPGTMFEWMLGILERAEGIRLQLEYNTDLHDEATIDRLLRHFQQLLENWLVNLDLRLDALPILTPAEQKNLVQEWNATRLELPGSPGITDRFEEQVRRTPAATAVQTAEGSLSYSQLNERANQLAHFLLGQGVGASKRVGLLGRPASSSFLIAFLGILKAGGCCVIFDPQKNLDLLASPNGAEALDLLLICGKLTPPPTPVKLRVINLETEASSLPQQPVTDPGKQFAAEQPACVCFSAGTSGPAKGAILNHRALLNGALVALRELGLQSSDRVALSWDEMLPSLLAGAELVEPAGAEPFSVTRWLSWVDSQGLTVAALPTFRWHEVAQAIAQNTASLPGKLRLMAIGGSRLSPKALAVWQRLAAGKIRLLDRFLLAETAGACAYTDPLAPAALAGRVSILRPAPNSQIYLVDANLKPVPIGVPGDLYVGGESLASNYLPQPNAAESAFVSNPFAESSGARLLKTGDTGRFLPGGGIELLGRVEDLEKTEAYRCEIAEVTATLLELPEVWDAVVIPREIAGEKCLVAYWVAANTGIVQKPDLRPLIASTLPAYMVPGAFVCLPSLPLTVDGRLDRRALPEPERPSSAAAFVPPKTPSENALAKIWCDILGLKQVGIRERFFEIGGHSLMAMQLVSRIKRELNFDLPLRTIFQHPTIERLALLISGQPIISRTSELIHMQPGGPGPDLVFLVDEGSLGLFKLAYLLDKNLPLYISVSPLPESALKAAAENRLEELPTMERLAADHVALIRSRKSRRPIILMGHCFGGELAFEVAYQLQQAGEQVESILMLDTWMARPGKWWKRKTWILAHLKKVLQQGPAYLWRKSRRRINLEKDDLASQLKLMADGKYNVHVPWFVIMRIYRRAVADCRREVLARPAVLFLSKDDWQCNAYRKVDNTLGTGRWFSGGVEVIDVPGDHVTVLDEVNLPQLARAFNDVLRKRYALSAPAEKRDAPVNAKK